MEYRFDVREQSEFDDLTIVFEIRSVFLFKLLVHSEFCIK
jgi:hypothetical protein